MPSPFITISSLVTAPCTNVLMAKISGALPASHAAKDLRI